MFSKDKEIQDLKNKLHELSDISSAGAVLAWDQETYMPAKGGRARAQQLATLAAIGHEKLTNPAVRLLIKEAGRVVKTDWDKALVREMGRAYTRAGKVPNALVRQMAVATSEAFVVWSKAKEKANFGLYKNALERVLRLRIQIAKLLQEKEQSVYDVMLDEFEPGLTEKEAARVFDDLKPKLITLAKELAQKTKKADKKIVGKWDVSMKILEEMGYDLQAGRQDVSAHPFTITFGIGDVRITTWKDQADPRPAIFATIHEAGHALYEQGVNPKLDRLYLGETGGLSGGTGLAMHESQSRLWENMVGRSPEFLKKFGLGKWVKAVNVVKPSLIRVEADEVTYGLHIMLRFEIERELVAEKIKVEDLPKAWNKKMKEYLGIEPGNDREGVLQDVHWAHGTIGYFPTYLLGTLMAAQLWHTISTKYLVLSAKIKDGDLKSLREWLRVNIHQHGRVYPTKELLKRVTGEDLNPKYYLEYLREKFERLYNSPVAPS